MKIYLASSALIKEGFDWIKTIEDARKLEVEGVQLYLNDTHTDIEYSEKVVALLKKYSLEVLWHLPNMPNEKQLYNYQYLINNIDSRGLIHHMPATLLPLKDANIGWENSKSGQFDKQHVLETFGKSRKDNTFFVFDITRIMYTNDPETDAPEIFDFIKKIIEKMSNTDIIHYTEKNSWERTGRESMCTFSEGILKPIIKDILDFGGVIVPEYESLRITRDSIDKMRMIN
jgi:hypothetical protein